MFSFRKKKLLDNTNKINCKNIISFQPENIFYLTGFWGEGVVLMNHDITKLFTPKLEYFRALEDSKECEIVKTERGNDALISIISELDNNNDYYCTDNTNYNIINQIKEKIGHNKIIVNEDPFFKTRSIKDEIEIKNIKKAANIIDKLYEICREKIKEGMTERELQSILVYETFKMGGGFPAYKSTLNPFIIASGINSALPHANVSERKFKRGDFIVVDLTLRFNGYVADATRTFGLKIINPEMKKIYDIVKKAQILGLNKCGNKIKIGEVDKICREYISQNGFANEFNHSTGHGIGLDVHEPPWIRSNNEELLMNNMTITVEPGIYFESKFGVRIEDSIIIDSHKKTGITNFNKFEKDLIII
ncbi:MAG TPA: Xaa-Pro peptidase family protein [Nitrososphaeraceae archaeon]